MKKTIYIMTILLFGFNINTFAKSTSPAQANCSAQVFPDDLTLLMQPLLKKKGYTVSHSGWSSLRLELNGRMVVERRAGYRWRDFTEASVNLFYDNGASSSVVAIKRIYSKRRVIEGVLSSDYEEFLLQSLVREMPSCLEVQEKIKSFSNTQNLIQDVEQNIGSNQ